MANVIRLKINGKEMPIVETNGVLSNAEFAAIENWLKESNLPDTSVKVRFEDINDRMGVIFSIGENGNADEIMGQIIFPTEDTTLYYLLNATQHFTLTKPDWWEDDENSENYAEVEMCSWDRIMDFIILEFEGEDKTFADLIYTLKMYQPI